MNNNLITGKGIKFLEGRAHAIVELVVSDVNGVIMKGTFIQKSSHPWPEHLKKYRHPRFQFSCLDMDMKREVDYFEAISHHETVRAMNMEFRNEKAKLNRKL